MDKNNAGGKWLLLLPSFMGYDREIFRVVTLRHDADLLDNIRYLPEMSRDLPLRLLKKAGLGHTVLYDAAGSRYARRYMRQADSGRDAYDVVFCVNGSELPLRFLERLRRKNPKAEFILYLWDDVSNMRDQRFFSLFDARYSYNIDDCKTYGFTFKPMFIQKLPEAAARDPEAEKKYDIAIIGTAHECRLAFARKVYEKYKDEFRFYVYMYHPDKTIGWFGHDRPLDYEEYFRIMRSSRVILDIPFIRQKGLTTRPYDACVARTKVLTTNEAIVRYPVCSENVRVLDREDPVIDRDFVFSPYAETDRKVEFAEEWIQVFEQHPEKL